MVGLWLLDAHHGHQEEHEVLLILWFAFYLAENTILDQFSFCLGRVMAYKAHID
jgi:hypothetical protein